MTQLNKKIAQNTVVQMVGKVLSTVFGLLAVAFLTRHLGTDGYGQLTVAISFLTLFAVVVDFGLTITTVQMISEKEADEEKIIGNLLSLRIISAIIFLALSPVIAIFFPYDQIVKIGIAVGTFSYLFGTTSQMLVGVFQKRLIMNRVVIAELANRALVLLGAILAPTLGLSLVGVMSLFIFGNAVQLLTILTFTRKHINFKLKIDLKEWLVILKRSWPIGISLVFNLIYLRGDILFLSLWETNEQIGIYGFAYKIVDVMTAFPVMYMGLMFPLLVTTWSARDQKFAKYMQDAFDFFSIVAIPLTLGGIAVGVPLMVMIGGEDFAESGKVLAIFGLVMTTIFFGTLYAHAIVAVQKQKVMTWGYLAVAIITILGYVIFIPRYGIWAAAWFTVLAELLITFATAFVVYKTSGFLPDLTLAGKAVFASILMYLTLQLIPGLHVLVQIGIAVNIYYVSLSILGGPKISAAVKLFLPEKASTHQL